MKKLYTFAALAVAFAMSVTSASAHTFELDSQESTPSISTNYNFSSSSSDSEAKPFRPKSSFEVDYFMLDDQSTIGASLVLGGLVFTGSYGSPNELPTGVDANCWSAGVGLNKRIYIFKFLYVEGRVGAIYNSSSTTVEGLEPVSVGNWGYFATPRVGLKLLENTCVTVGWNYNFADFKFDAAHTNKFMTAGVAFVF